MFVFENFIRDYKNSYKFFNNMFFAKFKIQNQLIKYAISLFNKLKYDKAYNTLLEEYKSLKGKSDRKDELKALLEAHRASIGLSKSGLETYVKVIQKKYKRYISSQEAQVIAADVWKSCNQRIKKGTKIHFKKLEDIHSVSAKSLTNGIKFDDTTNALFFNEFFVQLIFKDYNMSYIKQVFENKLKYCKLVRKPFNGGYRYYIQMVFDGNSPLKYTKGIGNTGIDPGTSTIASVSTNQCLLEELAKDSLKFNKKIINLQRKMERSRKANNPECYNENGTIKKGSKFKKSKNYKKLNMRLKSLYRKKSESKKLTDYLLIRQIASESSVIYCEKVNYKALAKKSKKETKKQKKTSIITKKDGTTKQITKNQKKKKFGKSLNNRGPAQFIERLKKKCDFLGIEFKYINTQKFKASQYNHIFDDYRKKDLNQRYVILYDENLEPIIIQRDLYSAFLIANSRTDLLAADRNKCILNFKEFEKNHNKCIEEIIKKETKRISSFGF